MDRGGWWRGELTKVFEEVWRGSLGEAVANEDSAPDEPRGEHVIVLAPTEVGKPGRQVMQQSRQGLASFCAPGCRRETPPPKRHASWTCPDDGYTSWLGSSGTA